MLTMKSLLPLILVLTTCWANDPIFDDVPPGLIQEVTEDYRLPRDVIPTEYDITLEPIFESKDKNNFTYDGKSVITLDIQKSTNTITFHSKDIDFVENEITLTHPKEKEPLKPILTKDTLKDFVILTFNKSLEKSNNVKLSLHYIGQLNDGLHGFYRSSYQNKDGKKIWLATTQFEPVHARQAFPCWDEPQLKAYFTIRITVPEVEGVSYTAISNMAAARIDNKRTYVFNKTPRMSTYLVAFVVSDFTGLQNENKNFSVWAKPTIEKSSLEFAFEYGWKVLEELKTFTNIDYYKDQKMNKMDQVAVPDFAAGAMENWGMVTYRESRLLYDVNKTTTENLQAITTIIAHEFSHQWFGNLVTCEWWDYIWLNEGFATFFQYYISNKIIPKSDKSEESWRLMEQFVIKNVQAPSLVVDATSKTRPLNPKNTVQTPVQIKSLFDDIAYKKGASILYMMYGFLSDEVFKKGFVRYLADHKDKGSVNSDKFFESIQASDEKKLGEYLPKDIQLKDVMKNWVYEAGYPVITVAWSGETVNITQERFFLEKPVEEDKTQWYIPINYITQDSPKEVKPADKTSRWMIPTEHKTFDKLNNTQWIIFNYDQTGYYRVNYDDLNWQHIASYLHTADYVNISAINRAQLIDDALNLARAGLLNYNISLPITLYLQIETDYIPWYAAVRAFNYLDSVLLGGDNYTEYHKYVAGKIKTFTEEANYADTENGTHVDRLAKVLALNTACKYGLKECEEFVEKKLKEWLEKKDGEDEKNLLPDLRAGILCGGLRIADEQTWNKTLQKYQTTEDKDEKADIFAGLGCASKSKDIAEKFLTLTLKGELDVDIFATMNSIAAGNVDSFDVLVKFMNDNIEEIRKADKEDSSLLIDILNKLSNKVVKPDQYAELSLLIYGQLRELTKVEGLSVAIQNLDWIKTYREDVEKWIIDNCGKICQKENSASSVALTSFLLIIPLLFTRFY